jgi:hypothetical protein
MERIGQWLARRPWEPASPQELEERVDAVVERVDGLEHRVWELERHEDEQPTHGARNTESP